MTKTYYPISHNRSEKLEVVPKDHTELVVLMTGVFGLDHYFYEEVKKGCVEKMRKEQLGKLDKILEVQ